MKTDEERPRAAIIGSANLVQNLHESFERFYYIDKKYFSALRICDELINMEPQNSSYYNWRALPLLALGEFEKAIEDYRKAFEIARFPLYVINEAHTHSPLLIRPIRRAIFSMPLSVTK
jgi:tetratricopeptide (TPR) repeat protein